MSNRSKMVVYVTGCAGFIGSYVTQQCLNNGWYVIGVDKMTYASRLEFIQDTLRRYEDRFKFIESDINDLSFLYDCDYVINCAAETHVGNSIVSSNEFVHSNINGVHNILELLKNYRQETGNKPTLIHFSTDEVYGDIETGSHTESDMLMPSNPYSATKAAADMLIKAWGRTHNIPYVIVRPTNNYGIGQYVEKLIPKAVKYLKLGKPIPLHNNGKPIRTWLHAKDTASAIDVIIKSGVKNEIFNISGGFEQTNYETVYKIIDCWNSLPTAYGEYLIVDYHSFMDFSVVREGQDVRYSLDDSKIRSLGWKPSVSFDSSILEIVKHYKNTFIW